MLKLKDILMETPERLVLNLNSRDQEREDYYFASTANVLTGFSILTNLIDYREKSPALNTRLQITLGASKLNNHIVLAGVPPSELHSHLEKLLTTFLHFTGVKFGHYDLCDLLCPRIGAYIVEYYKFRVFRTKNGDLYWTAWDRFASDYKRYKHVLDEVCKQGGVDTNKLILEMEESGRRVIYKRYSEFYA